MHCEERDAPTRHPDRRLPQVEPGLQGRELGGQQEGKDTPPAIPAFLCGLITGKAYFFGAGPRDLPSPPCLRKRSG